MSSDPDGGSLTNYSWDFGDGNTTSGNYPTISHSWNTTNSYTINLTVTDDESATNSFVHTINITDYDSPNARFNTTITTAYINETINFDGSMSNSTDGTITDYSWNFGDGNTTSGNYSTISHSWSSVNSYIINLTVTDSNNKTDWFVHTINITDYYPPTARFTFSPSDPEPTETVTFNASNSEDPDGTIVSYTWDFGDGTNGSNQIITKSYSKQGTYTVNLTVTDNQGFSNSFTQTMIVEEVGTHFARKIVSKCTVNILRYPSSIITIIPGYFSVEATIQNQADFKQEITVEYVLENGRTGETVSKETESLLLAAHETLIVTVGFPIPQEGNYLVKIQVVDPQTVAQKKIVVTSFLTWVANDQIALSIIIIAVVGLGIAIYVGQKKLRSLKKRKTNI